MSEACADPRYTCPPITAQPATDDWYSNTGSVYSVPATQRSWRNTEVPSRQDQPRFAPPSSRPRWSISSRVPWPTSPSHSEPSARSNENRHALRTPVTQISGRAPGTPTYGLPGGTQYDRPSHDRLTSSRTTLPSSVDRLCPEAKGSPAPPPSPSTQYRYPSGPNATCPPLWLLYSACGCVSTTCSRAGSPSGTRDS